MLNNRIIYLYGSRLLTFFYFQNPLRFIKLVSIFLKSATIFFLAIYVLAKNSWAQDYCSNPKKYYGAILNEVAKKNPYVIENLPSCLKQDRNLIFNVLRIDPKQFQNASEILHQDKIFIKRAVKANPEILQYVAPEVRRDLYFMEDAIFINRDALRYCAWSLLDNKLFMKKMVDLDSENYKFASDRLKSMDEFAIPALTDNGALLQYAPPNVKVNKDLVKIAINSDRNALQFANPDIASDPEIIKLAENNNPLPSPEIIEKFLNENYIQKNLRKNLGYFITNKGKFSKEKLLIDRNFIVKWGKKYNFDHLEKTGEIIEEWNLTPIEKRNYGIFWKEDFKKFTGLETKIERFFGTRRINPEIIADLRTTFLWKIKDDPLTLVFNIYSLSPSTDETLSNNFSNVTSLTAITQLRNNKWQLSVIDVIFNREIKINTLYENGHKKYVMWDIYKIDKKDKDLKLIFKVEDALSDHFEIFQEQQNGKYRRVYISKNIQGLD